MSPTATSQPSPPALPVQDDPPALRIAGLRKHFGKREILRGVDWQVPRGRVVGLLGRNGAGKTTLLRCLLGLSPIDGGDVELLGQPLLPPGGERLQRIGFVPQNFELFPWMKVRAYLDFTAAFYPRWNRPLCERLLDEWLLDRRQKIGQLSQGQRQKLAIVRALAVEPELLVLDEPVASLDPQARHAFMDELLDLLRQGERTVIFSTHITADLERAGADIALLRDGRMQFTRPLEELRRRIVRVRMQRPAGWTSAPALAGQLHVQVRGEEARWLLEDADPATLQTIAAGEGARLLIEQPTLEDLFVALA